MIELVMVALLGAAAAALLGLLVLPLVTRRAARQARMALERRLPLSLDAIAAERDGLRASHAVDLCNMEQRAAAMTARLAAALAESGRHSLRAADLAAEATRARTALQASETALAAVRDSLKAAEARLATQAADLADAGRTTAAVQAARDAAEARVAAVEALFAQQRSLLGELEQRLVAAEPERTASEPMPVAPPEAETSALPAAEPPPLVERLRAGHGELARSLAETQGERDRLRLRVDELLLRIEGLEDTLEEATEQAEAGKRRQARHDKTVTALTARVAARDDALALARRQLAEQGRRATLPDIDGTTPRTPGELRAAVAALAAELVRFGTEPGSPDAPAEPAGRDATAQP